MCPSVLGSLLCHTLCISLFALKLFMLCHTLLISPSTLRAVNVVSHLQIGPHFPNLCHTVSIQVATCTSCVTPTASLSGPTFFREPCTSTDSYSPIFISSSSSSDPSGRALMSRTYGLRTGSYKGLNCASHDLSDTSDALVGAVNAANK